MVFTLDIEPEFNVALTTSRVFVFFPASGDEKAIYILLLSLKLGSRIIPDRPP